MQPSGNAAATNPANLTGSAAAYDKTSINGTMYGSTAGFNTGKEGPPAKSKIIVDFNFSSLGHNNVLCIAMTDETDSKVVILDTGSA